MELIPSNEACRLVGLQLHYITLPHAKLVADKTRTKKKHSTGAQNICPTLFHDQTAQFQLPADVSHGDLLLVAPGIVLRRGAEATFGFRALCAFGLLSKPASAKIKRGIILKHCATATIFIAMKQGVEFGKFRRDFAAKP